MQKEYDGLKFMDERFCANKECCVTTLNLLKWQAEMLPSCTCIPATGWPAALTERSWKEPTTLMVPKPGFLGPRLAIPASLLNLDCIFKKTEIENE